MRIIRTHMKLLLLPLLRNEHNKLSIVKLSSQDHSDWWGLLHLKLADKNRNEAYQWLSKHAWVGEGPARHLWCTRGNQSLPRATKDTAVSDQLSGNITHYLKETDCFCFYVTIEVSYVYTPPRLQTELNSLQHSTYSSIAKPPAMARPCIDCLPMSDQLLRNITT